jgi:hypothetical protein
MALRPTSRSPARPPIVTSDIGTIGQTVATGNDLEIQAETASAETAAAIAVAVTKMLTVMKR